MTRKSSHQQPKDEREFVPLGRPTRRHGFPKRSGSFLLEEGVRDDRDEENEGGEDSEERCEREESEGEEDGGEDAVETKEEGEFSNEVEQR